MLSVGISTDRTTTVDRRCRSQRIVGVMPISSSAAGRVETPVCTAPLGAVSSTASSSREATATGSTSSLINAADVAWSNAEQEPLPALAGFSGPSVVRIVRELKDLLLTYRGREDPDDLEEFLRRASLGVYPKLRVALTMAIIAGAQAAAEAGIPLLYDAESRTTASTISVDQSAAAATFAVA